MFSKPAKPRSIASQLVILFTLAAALLLSSGLGVLYWIFVRHAVEEDRAVLADRISVLRADLTRTSDLSRLNEQLSILHEGEHAPFWVRIVDSEGRTVAETPGMNDLLPTNVFPKPAVRQLPIATARIMRRTTSCFRWPP
jgi:hypothetical protein